MRGASAVLRCWCFFDAVNKISICGVTVISNLTVCNVCVFLAAVFSEMKLFAVLWFLEWLGDAVIVNFFCGVAVFRAPHVPLLNRRAIISLENVHDKTWPKSVNEPLEIGACVLYHRGKITTSGLRIRSLSVMQSVAYISRQWIPTPTPSQSLSMPMPHWSYLLTAEVKCIAIRLILSHKEREKRN